MGPSIQSQQDHSLLENEMPHEEQADLYSNPATPVYSDINVRPLLARDPASFWKSGIGDVILALGAAYFIVLGLVSFSQNGKTVDEVSWLPSLVTAATYGPTFFPILFSAALGRFLTQLAYYRLERGTSVQTMEQLQGSQTVISTLMTQFTLRTWDQHFLLIAGTLLSIWTLSPLGSQASLRFVTLVDRDQIAFYNISYLNVTAGYYSPYDYDYSIGLANSLLDSQIMLPEASRSEPQDIYGNLRIPLLEQLQESPSLEWIDVSKKTAEYSSILGIPISLNGSDAAHLAFSFNTSYWWLDCTVELVANTVNLTNGTFGYAAVSGDFVMAWNQTYYFRGDDVPRKLNIGAPNVRASNQTFISLCSLTSTFVTINATCQQPSSGQKNCTTAAIRHTSLNASESSRTRFDTGGVGRDQIFLQQLITSTNFKGASDFVPAVFGFLADPGNPFNFHREYPDWSTVTARDFSVRISQVLNTYWLAATAYQPIRGFYIVDEDYAIMHGGLGNGGFQMNNTNATGWTPQATLDCSRGWSTILLLAALVVLAAATASLVLGSRRRCPDVLNSFSALLRDNPYASMRPSDTANSLSDGSQLAKAWRSEKVRIGNVMDDKCEEGYVAIGTPGTVSITPLRSKHRQA